MSIFFPGGKPLVVGGKLLNNSDCCCGSSSSSSSASCDCPDTGISAYTLNWTAFNWYLNTSCSGTPSATCGDGGGIAISLFSPPPSGYCGSAYAGTYTAGCLEPSFTLAYNQSLCRYELLVTFINQITDAVIAYLPGNNPVGSYTSVPCAAPGATVSVNGTGFVVS